MARAAAESLLGMDVAATSAREAEAAVDAFLSRQADTAADGGGANIGRRNRARRRA